MEKKNKKKNLLHLSLFHKLDGKLLSKGYKKGSGMKPPLCCASIMKQDPLAAAALKRKGFFFLLPEPAVQLLHFCALLCHRLQELLVRLCVAGKTRMPIVRHGSQTRRSESFCQKQLFSKTSHLKLSMSFQNKP